MLWRYETPCINMSGFAWLQADSYWDTLYLHEWAPILRHPVSKWTCMVASWGQLHLFDHENEHPPRPQLSHLFSNTCSDGLESVAGPIFVLYRMYSLSLNPKERFQSLSPSPLASPLANRKKPQPPPPPPQKKKHLGHTSVNNNDGTKGGMGEKLAKNQPFLAFFLFLPPSHAFCPLDAPQTNFWCPTS